MSCECNNVLTYKKAIPAEVINIGDIIMLDVESGYIKKAVLERHCEYSVNSRLVVGICISSDNESKQPIVIDGGSCEVTDRVLLDGGTAEVNIQTIKIEGGTSEEPSSTIIQVGCGGIMDVNTVGPIRIGNQLCISPKPGKAQSKDFDGREFYNIRSIGRVIKIPQKDKATIILDIE